MHMLKKFTKISQFSGALPRIESRVQKSYVVMLHLFLASWVMWGGSQKFNGLKNAVGRKDFVY